VSQEHHHQATITPHHLVHRVSGVQLQDGVHIPVTPASMPRLNSSLSPASGVSRPGPVVTQEWTRQSLRQPMMSIPPGFPLQGRDHGLMSVQHPSTLHPLQQQQRFSPSMPSSFLSTFHEQHHPPLVAQQPILPSFGGSMQHQYPQLPPGIPGMMPQWHQQPVQPQQQVGELYPTQLPDAIQVILKCIGLFIYN